jgi:hypothetical protein
MDAYDKCTNLGKKKILQIVVPSMVLAENFSDHPHIFGPKEAKKKFVPCQK